MKPVVGRPPKIIISKTALKWMSAMIDNHSTEIAWLNIVDERDDNTYFIHSTFYPDHCLVEKATCEISEKGDTQAAMYFINKYDDEEYALKIRCWGHSHVKMVVIPSDQDDHQAMDYLSRSNEYFIRLIANKMGDINITFYSVKDNIIYEDLLYTVENDYSGAMDKLQSIQGMMSGTRENTVNKVLKDVYEELIRDDEYESIVNKVLELKEVNVPKKKSKSTYTRSGGSKNSNIMTDTKTVPDEIQEGLNRHYGMGGAFYPEETGSGFDDIDECINEEFDPKYISRFGLESLLGNYIISSTYDTDSIQILLKRGIVNEDEFTNDKLIPMYSHRGEMIAGTVSRDVLVEHAQANNDFNDKIRLTNFFNQKQIDFLSKRKVISISEGKSGVLKHGL